MNPSSQDDLLGYLLGALDAQEQRDLQQKIDNDPALEESLLDLKAAIGPLECMDTKGYRPGLARRACEAVANWDTKSATSRLAFLDQNEIDWEEGCELQPNQTPALAPAIEPSEHNTNTVAEVAPRENPIAEDSACVPGSVNTTSVDTAEADTEPRLNTLAGGEFKVSSWSMRDMLVGVAALAVLAGLLFPALNYSRKQGRLTACQNNLRQIGIAFMDYSSIHEGEFPSIPRQGNLAVSGCYAPILKSAGLVTDDSVFTCAGVTDTLPVVIPSVEQVEAAETETQRSHYRKTMGGHFGYSMGFQDGDRYQAPRAGIANVVLLADQPSNRSDRQSRNHGGNGQNCLFGDGRVTFVSGPAYGEDLVYENDRGIVGPGTHALDSVIGPSHLSPTL